MVGIFAHAPPPTNPTNSTKIGTTVSVLPPPPPIKVTANMTETAIELRRKKQLHQKMINHFAMEQMRKELASKYDMSEEMIQKMGMEEMISYLVVDYKTATKKASK